MAKKIDVIVVMGSDSDLSCMQGCIAMLEKFNIANEVKILSAHRSPNLIPNFIKDIKKKDVKVIVAAAGGAAHLAGVLASHMILPVIGVPMDSKHLKGMDSLLSTVQMPSGVPVATVAIGDAGAKNAAVLACQILALNNRSLQKKLERYKSELLSKIKEKNRKLSF